MNFKKLFGFNAKKTSNLTEITGGGRVPRTSPRNNVMRYVAGGDVEGLRHCLEAGGDPNECQPDGSQVTALMLVAMKGDATSAKLLLHAGADVDTQDANGWTALMQAIQQGRSMLCVSVLLDGGADVSIELGRGRGITASTLASNSTPEIARAIADAVKARNDKEAAKTHVFVGNVTIFACFQVANLHIEMWDGKAEQLAFGISGTRVTGLIDKTVRVEFVDARCAVTHAEIQDLADCWIRIQQQFTELIMAGNWRYDDALWQRANLVPLVVTALDHWTKKNVTNPRFGVAFGTAR